MTRAVHVLIDIGDVETGLAALERRAKALTPVMKSLMKPLRDDQRNHQRAREGASESWAPRSLATMAAAHHRRMARAPLGRLTAAVIYRADAGAVTGTSLVKWSLAHQDGERVGRGTRLPKREFLYISGEMQDLATTKIVDAVADAYGGSR